MRQPKSRKAAKWADAQLPTRVLIDHMKQGDAKVSDCWKNSLVRWNLLRARFHG